jgi:hypothetical protein
LKTLLWILTALAAIFWTVPIALLASLTRWLAGSTTTLNDGVQAVSQWPLPEWIVQWLGPQWIEPTKALIAQGVDMLIALGPWMGSVLSWAAPLLWIVWALGMLLLLVLAGLGGMLLGSKPDANAQVQTYRP